MVPLLYGGLYLWAFWDPYSRLGKLPVAVVNLDLPVTSDGTTVQAGNDLVAELQTSKTFAWQVVSKEEAAERLQDGDCQVALTIPADFSAALVSASGDAPVKAELVVEDKGTNILVSQITARVLGEVQSAVSRKASAGYFGNIYVSFSHLHATLQQAANSAGKLATGRCCALEGATDLHDGLAQAGTGAAALSTGMGKLAAGSIALKDGSQTVTNGVSVLAEKLGEAAGGATTLAQGVSTASDGATTLAAGVNRLQSEGETFANQFHHLSEATAQLAEAQQAMAACANGITASGTNLAAAASRLAELAAKLAAEHSELADDPTLAAVLSTSSQVKVGAGQLAEQLAGTSTIAQNLATKTATVSAGARSLGDGIDKYLAGVNAANTGTAQLSSALQRLRDGSQTLTAGLTAAQSGASALVRGGAQLASGAQTLSAALGTAGSKTRELSQALGSMTSGAASLATGIAKGADGAQQLATGLSAGASKIPDYSAAQVEQRADVMAAPVSLEETTDHVIPNYGTGFAPYFIPLALWVGALMAYFLVRPLSPRALSSTASSLTATLSGFLPAAAVTTAQAVIMALVLQFALGLQPANVPAFYLFTILVALVSTAIMQFLAGSMGTAGKFIAVVLLMLQLTSAAGTFPFETIPRFFQLINPYLPMTYVVLGLRQVITTGDMQALAGHAGILIAFGALALCATYLVVRRRRIWTIDRLKPAFTL
jgi:putative membrane protein